MNGKLIVIVWLGYLRNEGGKNDCYRVFWKMVEKVDFPSDVEQLIEGSNIF
ncbi:type II toxin-antitoxin system YhaV family toxin [Pseudanabaena sp. SR411]|uniref:type II toxin-antitoxin system YhaV family toxin n=1 Tax=Pseudanabaena sp. SR411 TaxID=1980935 RepID=UPI00113FE586